MWCSNTALDAGTTSWLLGSAVTGIETVGTNYTQFSFICLSFFYQEDTLLAWTMPGDYIWTKGLYAAEPKNDNVSACCSNAH